MADYLKRWVFVVLKPGVNFDGLSILSHEDYIGHADFLAISSDNEKYLDLISGHEYSLSEIYSNGYRPTGEKKVVSITEPSRGVEVISNTQKLPIAQFEVYKRGTFIGKFKGYLDKTSSDKGDFMILNPIEVFKALDLVCAISASGEEYHFKHRNSLSEDFYVAYKAMYENIYIDNMSLTDFLVALKQRYYCTVSKHLVDDTEIERINVAVPAKRLSGIDNPDNLPLYDRSPVDIVDIEAAARDMGQNKKIRSWKIDFRKFWKDSSYKPNELLYGLGDFINSSARNAISVTEYSPYISSNSPYYGPRKNPADITEPKICDDRVIMAVPWRILVDPNKLTDDILSELNITGGLTINSPCGSGTLGYNQYENMVMGRIPGVFDEEVCAGLYFDVVFDDGTTLACITGDGKGTHMGQLGLKNGTPLPIWCYDPFCEGYAHLRLKSANVNDRSYISVLELCGYTSSAKLNFNFKSKRIKEIITYGIQHKPNEKNQYISWTQKCNLT